MQSFSPAELLSSLSRRLKSPRLYRLIRTLHLYAGLLVAPLLLVFAVSVLVINHRHPVADERPEPVVEETFVETIPSDLDSIEAAAGVMRQIGISGWITFYRHVEERGQFRFVVLRPTVRRNVTVDLDRKSVRIESLANDLKSTLYWLHVYPGPHTRYKNWFFLFLWWALADSVAYGAIFLGASGIYLWYFIKQERRIGLVLVTAGLIVLGLLVAPLVGGG